jgi:predicted DNA binding CopG/RHH family protein
MKKTTFMPKPASNNQATTNLDAFVGLPPEETLSKKMKRLTIDISPSLHRRVKTGCAARGIEMADFLRQFLEKEFPV